MEIGGVVRAVTHRYMMFKRVSSMQIELQQQLKSISSLANNLA